MRMSYTLLLFYQIKICTFNMLYFYAIPTILILYLYSISLYSQEFQATHALNSSTVPYVHIISQCSTQYIRSYVTIMWHVHIVQMAKVYTKGVGLIVIYFHAVCLTYTHHTLYIAICCTFIGVVCLLVMINNYTTYPQKLSMCGGLLPVIITVSMECNICI